MENNTTQKGGSLLLTAFLCSIILGLSIAYAALSATLNVTVGKITQNSLSWNVGFQTGSVTGTAYGATGLVCGTATVTANTVSIANSTLTTLHDKCTYPLTIQNTGTVGATLGNIAQLTPSGVSCTGSGATMVCGNITYKLATNQAGSTLLTTNLDLAAQTGTQPVYFIAEYTGETTGGEASVQQNVGFTLTYNQK